LSKGCKTLTSLKTELFNKKTSNLTNMLDAVFESLNLTQDKIVANVGVVGGYYTIGMAEIVGVKGRVYAIDTKLNVLKYVEEKAKNKGLDNIRTILAEEDFFVLPKKVDLILMRNVCHHLKNRLEYFMDFNKMLRCDGIVAIIENEKDVGCTFPCVFGHYVPKKTLVKEMRETGFRLVKSFTFLPYQSFTIYKFA